MKQWTIRMPEEMLKWLRAKAAMETVNRNMNVSINAVTLEIIEEAIKNEKNKFHVRSAYFEMTKEQREEDERLIQKHGNPCHPPGAKKKKGNK